LSLKVGFGRNGRAPETDREGRLRRGVCGLRLTRSLAKKRRYFGHKSRHRQPNRSDIGGAEFRARPTRAASIHLQRHHLSAGRNHQTPGVVGRHLNRIVSNRAARDFQRVLIFPRRQFDRRAFDVRSTCTGRDLDGLLVDGERGFAVPAPDFSRAAMMAATSVAHDI